MERRVQAEANVRALDLCVFGQQDAQEMRVLRIHAESAVRNRISERLSSMLDAPMCARMSQDALTVLDSVLVGDFIHHMTPVYSIARLC